MGTFWLLGTGRFIGVVMNRDRAVGENRTGIFLKLREGIGGMVGGCMAEVGDGARFPILWRTLPSPLPGANSRCLRTVHGFRDRGPVSRGRCTRGYSPRPHPGPNS